LKISKKKSSKNTFGWVRAEVLGALINSVFLISLCVNMLIETAERLIHAKHLKDVNLLLYAAITGLLINLVGLFIFGHGHGHSHDLPPQAVKELQELVENEVELEEITIDNSIQTNGVLTRERQNSDRESDTSKNHHESKKCFPFSKFFVC
jgi:Co/Zn/Cd efflux system component